MSSDSKTCKEFIHVLKATSVISFFIDSEKLITFTGSDGTGEGFSPLFPSIVLLTILSPNSVSEILGIGVNGVSTLPGFASSDFFGVGQSDFLGVAPFFTFSDFLGVGAFLPFSDFFGVGLDVDFSRYSSILGYLITYFSCHFSCMA
ncbi:hypothetical protein SDC9_169035 [bioreactor metagenome]|uniref:Uncharacterized protein n=1 Tax=bioreactor metagenome TaxID=1076179 RepID=A0A645G4T2_9ZZZZ